MSDWAADCLKWRGKVLTGAHRHYCREWDGLPVDETCTNEWPCGCDVPARRLGCACPPKAELSCRRQDCPWSGIASPAEAR